MKIGLYFGSFNPIHIGHMAIANYMVEFTEIEQLWFVISPLNPLKKKSNLLADYHRYELVNLAIGDSSMFKVSNIEFKLPKPSYTIDTLTYMAEKYPLHEFVLIMGADNMDTIEKWKNYQLLLENYQFFVYPRPGIAESQYYKHKNVDVVKAPHMEISSSFIRNSIKEGKNLRYFLPEKVFEYISEMHFYEK